MVSEPDPDSAQASAVVRTALADLTTLQRRAGPDASRSDTKAGSDAALVNGQVIPALDKLLALFAMIDAYEPGPDRDATVSSVQAVAEELRTAGSALYDQDAKYAVQTVVEALPAIEEPA